MTQKITKIAQQCFDLISKDASVMNNFRKDNNLSKVWSHNKKTANFFENLLLKNKTYEKYSKVQEYHNNVFFSLKSLLDKNFRQKPIRKQTTIERVNRVLKDITQCINWISNIRQLMQKEKPFSDEDRRSLLNTIEYLSKLNSNLSIVDESLRTIVMKWDDLIDKKCDVKVSLTKIMENAQEMSRQMVSYAYKSKNANQNTFYSFSLDQNYIQIKKTNEDVIKNMNFIKTTKDPYQKDQIATYVDSTYLLILFIYEAIIKVKDTFISYTIKNSGFNLKATQQHINSLRKYITDIQTQLQSINKLFLGRQPTLKQKVSQKPPQTKPPTSPIQTPTKTPFSQSITSPLMEKSQSQSYSPHLHPSPKRFLSGSQVSADNQSRFSDIGSEKLNKSGVKQSKIQQQKGESPLAQLIRLVSQNDEKLAKLIPKPQHQPPAYTTFNCNHREMLVLQQKNNKAVQIAIDLFQKHQNDHKQNVSNSSSAEKGKQKEQNTHGVDDTVGNLEVLFTKQDVENARKQTEEKVRKELECKNKQAIEVLNGRINQLTVQLSGKEETHNRVVAGLKGEIDKIKCQLETNLAELQIQRDMQTSLSSYLDTLIVQNNKLKQIITALQTTNKQLRDKNNQSQEQPVQKQINEKIALKNQLIIEIQNLTKMKFTAERITHLLAQKEKQLESVGQELIFKIQQIQDIVKYVQLHNAEIAQKQQKVQSLNKQLQKLQQTHKSTIQKQQEQKTTLNTQLSQLQSKLQTAKNQLTSVQDQMNTSKELLANVNDQKQIEAMMRKQIETLTGQVNYKKQQLEGLNSETTQKQLALSELEKKYSQTKREEDKVNGEITLLNQISRNKKESIDTWQKQTIQTKKSNEQKLQQQLKLNDDLAYLRNQIAKNKDILKLQSSASEYQKKLTEFRMLQATNTQKLKAFESEINLKQQILKETRMSIVNMISSINIGKLREDISQIKKSCNQLKSSQRKTTLDQEKQSLASFSKKLQTADQKLSFFLQIIEKGRKTSKNTKQNLLKVEIDQEWLQKDIQQYVQLFEDKLKAELQLVVQELNVKMLETNQHEMNYQSLLKDTDDENKRLRAYRQQISKLQQTKQQRIQQNNQLIKTKQQIQNQLTALKQQYQSYIISQFGSIKQTSDYESTIDNLQSTINNLQRSLQSERQQNKKLFEENKQLSLKLESMFKQQCELTASSQKIIQKSILQQKQQQHKQNTMTMNAKQLAQVKQLIRQLKDQVKNNDTRVQNQCSVINQNYQDIKTQWKSIVSNIKLQQTQKITQLQQTLTILQHTLQQQRQQNLKLQQRFKQKQDQVQNLNKQLKDNLGRNTDQLIKLRAQLKEKTQKLEDQKHELQSLSLELAEMQELRIQVGQLKEQLKVRGNEGGKMKDSGVRVGEKQLRVKEEKIEEMMKENQMLRKQLEEAKEMLKMNDEQFNKALNKSIICESEQLNVKQFTQQQVRGLQNQLEYKNDRIQQLQAQVLKQQTKMVDLSNSISQHERTIDQQRNSIETLEKVLALKQGQLSRLFRQLENSKLQIQQDKQLLKLERDRIVTLKKKIQSKDDQIERSQRELINLKFQLRRNQSNKFQGLSMIKDERQQVMLKKGDSNVTKEENKL